MKLSSKLKNHLEKLNNYIEAVQAKYLLENGQIIDYYFYYNENSDPVLAYSEGQEPIAINIPSSVHNDIALTKDKVTITELNQVINSYRMITENQLEKTVTNGKVIRKRVKTIKKPERVLNLKNKITGKKASLFSKTAVANVKRKRSNRVRDILNLDKKNESKEKEMGTRELFNRQSHKLNETYCTYPEARSIAIDIDNCLYLDKFQFYPIKYPTAALAKMDKTGWYIEFGSFNKKWMSQDQWQDIIAKDILQRFARGEDLPEEIKGHITLRNLK